MAAIRNAGTSAQEPRGQVQDPKAMNRRTGRGWRCLQSAVTRIVLSAGALLAVTLLLQAALHRLGIRPHSAAGLAGAALLVVAVLATYGGCVRFLEQRTVVEL